MKRNLLVVALVTTSLSWSLLYAAESGVYEVTELFTVGSPSDAKGSIPIISALTGSPTESASAKSFDIDEDGSIVFNLSVSTQKGWEPVDAEGAFRKANGRKPNSPEELAEWRKGSYLDTPPASDEERIKAWQDYKSGPNRRHPGVRPVVEATIMGLRISPDGKILEKKDGEIAVRHSALVQPKAFPSDDPQVAWFNQNVQLPEYADRKREIKYRDGKQIKSRMQRAFFAEGSILGQDRHGNSIYLMTISVPWNRAHRHGVADYVCRVYVVSPDKKVLSSNEAYPAIKMRRDSGDLYEIYSGPYKGLSPSLDPEGKQAWTLRRWSAD